MIYFHLSIGPEEQQALISIALETAQAKKQRRVYGILCIIMSVVMLALAAYSAYTVGLDIMDVILLIFSGIMLVLAMGGLKLLQRYFIRRLYQKMDEALRSGDREYQISEEGISVVSEIGNGNNTWSAFREWGEQDHFLWIRRVDNNIVLLDKEKITADELCTVLEYLKQIGKEAEKK